jgi:hypothetical protein
MLIFLLMLVIIIVIDCEKFERDPQQESEHER